MTRTTTTTTSKIWHRHMRSVSASSSHITRTHHGHTTRTAGNIYSNSEAIGAARVHLNGGATYHLFARVRGKAPLRFHCSVTQAPVTSTSSSSARLELQPVAKSSRPDVVRGRLLSLDSVVAIDVRNTDPTRWATVSATVVEGLAGSGGKSIIVTAPKDEITQASTLIRVAPGAAARVVVSIVAHGPAVERDVDGCARFEVDVGSHHEDVDDANPLQVRRDS